MNSKVVGNGAPHLRNADLANMQQHLGAERRGTYYAWFSEPWLWQ
jgi:hypothetical protein